MRRYDEDRESRGASWVAAERRRLASWSRGSLIEWLVWNDPNGTYRDEDMDPGEPPLSHEEALEIVMRSVAENSETPEEMRGASARARLGGWWVR